MVRAKGGVKFYESAARLLKNLVQGRLKSREFKHEDLFRRGVIDPILWYLQSSTKIVLLK